MNGKEILTDTNILLYLLKGNSTVQEFLQGKTVYISFVTELELLGFKQLTPEEDQQIQNLLADCVVVPLTAAIKKNYVQLRKTSPLKLADAIIAATAFALELPLISADKQFKKVTDLRLISYEI